MKSGLAKEGKYSVGKINSRLGSVKNETTRKRLLFELVCLPLSLLPLMM